MSKTVGDEFQAETKYARNRMSGGRLNWTNKPETYKSYPSSKTVQLPRKVRNAAMDFGEVLQRRKSIRVFSDEPLSLIDLGFLLWASTGIQRVEQGYEFRTAPSAGALYPVETYVAANNVEGLECSLYHYNIKDHLLEEVNA